MTARPSTVELGSAPISRFRPLLGDGAWGELEQTMLELATAVRGRVVWNINSTARGGGVAELLSSLIPYDRDAGVDERWLVIEGSQPFFDITKRIHNLLHGVPSNGSEITAGERHEYERTIARNAKALVDVVRRRDVVILHDPQAAGLVPPLLEHGAHVIWRSHVGVDKPNHESRAAWDVLRRYLTGAAALVFSRRSYVWEGLDPARVHIIPPTIDPFSVKNEDLDEEAVTGILAAAGILEGSAESATFKRVDGALGRIERRATLDGSTLPRNALVTTQVSRWDRLKDPLGVLEAFAQHVASRSESRLILAGPSAESVRDDPEQPEVLGQVIARREQLKPAVRDRVQIAQLPMGDVDENAFIVNALQRRSDVIVQKSLAEGFGLTVAEAMWKARPIVASRVGGIEDQIEDGKSGLLIDDPADLEAVGDGIVRLLADRSVASSLGIEARRRATSHFIAPRHLEQQARLILGVIDRDGAT